MERHLGERLSHPRSRIDGVQEVAFTLANGIAYIDAGRARGPRA